MIFNNSAVVHKSDGKASYPTVPPFHPSDSFPECPFGQELSKNENTVYRSIREVFKLLRLDQKAFNAKKWNPLGELIHPGDTVVIKPNLIKEKHQFNDDWEYIITHGSVIRAMADYVVIALRGSGTLRIIDGPQYDSNFDKICKENGIYKILDFLRSKTKNIKFELINLQQEYHVVKDEVIVKRIKLPEDPDSYIEFDLGQKSEFFGHAGRGHYYGADYDYEEVNRHHDGFKNEYLLSKSALYCDVFINLPKLKTHKKAGITCNLKNLVGINGNRNYLPHHTRVPVSKGGDQYPREALKIWLERTALKYMDHLMVVNPKMGALLYRPLKRIGKKIFGKTEDIIRSGNWYGNDTVWRMILDLNKCLFYGKKDGSFSKSVNKRFLSIVDGIVAGEGNGPIAPNPVLAGLLVAGFNPVVVDTICAILMGFDYHKIPVLDHAWKIAPYPQVSFQPQNIRCISNITEWSGTFADIGQAPHFGFEPPFGWKGYMERKGGINLRNQRHR